MGGGAPAALFEGQAFEQVRSCTRRCNPLQIGVQFPGQAQGFGVRTGFQPGGDFEPGAFLPGFGQVGQDREIAALGEVSGQLPEGRRHGIGGILFISAGGIRNGGKGKDLALAAESELGLGVLPAVGADIPWGENFRIAVRADFPDQRVSLIS